MALFSIVKRWYYIVLAGLLLLGIGYIYLHRQDLGLVGPPSGVGDGSGGNASIASLHPPRINWTTVERPNAGFRVEMPVDGKEIQVPAYNENGGTDQVNMLFAYPAADITFSVAWADNPPVVRVNGQTPDRILDMARDEALTRTQTTLSGETKLMASGFPARDIVARNAGGGVLDTRLVLVGRRLYMLTTAFPSADVRREQDVLRFFNSFTVLRSRSIPESLPPA